MKKFLIVICVLIVIAVGGALYANGMFDTRFWSYDKTVYSEFYNGTHVGGKDILPGTYVVDIKGGSQDTGSVAIWSEDDKKELSCFWIHRGDKSFQFTIEQGQILKVWANVGREMRIRKVS